MNELQRLSKEALVERYDSLIRSIAVQVKARLCVNTETAELVSCGRLGLLEAAERFDQTMGVSFKTFAYYRIRGAMYDGLRKMEVITRRRNPRLQFEEAASQFLNSEANRGSSEPRRSSLKDDIQEVYNLISSLVPIYFLASETLDNLPGEESRQSAEQAAAFGQEKQALRQAIGQLSANERSLIELYYYEDITLEEAASRLGLSKSWASRLHARAISKLRDALQAKIGRGTR
jgi:RNA polymerase sigma factor for flagellar operon FliA